MTQWRLNVSIQQALAEDLALLLEEEAIAVSWHETTEDGDVWDVQALYAVQPDEADLIARVQGFAKTREVDISKCVVEPVPATDWLEATWRNFPPQHVGPFFIYGSHYQGKIPANLIGLHVNAATAFGSGEHQTTRGCLTAIADLSPLGEKAMGLDMGCGSGILAMALVKKMGIPMLAVDNDSEAVRVAQANAHLNDCEDLLQTRVSEGFDNPDVWAYAPYDVITANILAQPLIEMAPDMAKAVKSGGYVILSGLLERQSQDVLHAYHREGFVTHTLISMDQWTTCVLKKGSKKSIGLKS